MNKCNIPEKIHGFSDICCKEGRILGCERAANARAHTPKYGNLSREFPKKPIREQITTKAGLVGLGVKVRQLDILKLIEQEVKVAQKSVARFHATWQQRDCHCKSPCRNAGI